MSELFGSVALLGVAAPSDARSRRGRGCRAAVAAMGGERRQMEKQNHQCSAAGGG